MHYDVIGDIHGQMGKLSELMTRLGYRRSGRGWKAPAGRQAVFIGDLIDRGPQQVEVIAAVREMVDGGDAVCVMGNHEFNAVAFATPREDGHGYLRAHSPRNEDQHGEFLRQVGRDSALHRECVSWFRTLPVALDLGPIRAVHAWWHAPHVEVLSRYPAQPLRDDAFLQRACAKDMPEGAAMEGLTKGMEIALPDGHGFHDHEGVRRHEIRARWWDAQARSYRDLALVPESSRHELPEAEHPEPMPHATDKPVFIGHYWMDGVPALQAPQVACVDYSAARHGPLVAYRWQGERLLDPAHFVTTS